MSSKLCRRLAAALAAALLVGSAALPQAAVSAGVKIPILTYHDLTRDPDDVDDMTVTDERFRLDMEFLKEFGYTPLLSADLVAIHKGAAAMPDKPVMITFDDGYWSNYSIAYPILQQTGMKAVISPIVGETDRYTENGEVSENYTHLTWEEIREMMDSGLVEFQNHSYALHKLSGQGERTGISKNPGESTESYQAAIREDIARAQERFAEMTGWTPTAFTYPFGAVSEDSYPVLEELGFRATLDAQGRLFLLTRDPACLQRIPRFNRPWGTPVWEILEKAGG